MNLPNLYSDRLHFRMADHGGHSVKGGGADSDPAGSGAAEIADALGESIPDRGNLPGVNDPGVPGSKTNPVEEGRPAERLRDEPVGRPGGGSASGS